jgi:phospholipid/cholesterol/gamma-HCH transport system substrate-binding protein
MDERRLEIKVGALVLAALAGLLTLLWVMGELSFTRRSSLHVAFGHTGNVVVGAPVKLGGVPVGRVNRVLLDAEARDDQGAPLPVRMELSVDAKTLAALRSDVQVTVSSQGPLGESYLELLPGSPTAPRLQEGQVLRGIDAPRIDLVANRLSRFLDALTRIIDQDPEAFEALVSSLSRLSTTLEHFLSANQNELGTILTELSAASQDLRLLAQFARKVTEPGGKGAQLLDDAAFTASALRKDVPATLGDARTTLRALSFLTGPLTAEDGQRLKTALERYTAAGQRLENLTTRAERILAQIEAGQGTMGGLYKDPEIYQQLKALVTDLKKHPWKVLWKSD